MAAFVSIYRHELPTDSVEFTIGAHGFKPLTLRLEDGVPVIYEIGATSPDDKNPYPHHFVWVATGEELPHGCSQTSYVGTINIPDGMTLHLFQNWQ